MALPTDAHQPGPASSGDRARQSARFETELIEDLGRLSTLGGELDSLQERTGAPPSARWAAVHAGMAHDRRFQPWCVIVRQGPEIVASALAVARPRLGAWAIHGATQQDEPGWLAALDRPASDALAAALVGSLNGLRRPWGLALRHLPAGDPTLATLRADLPVSAMLASAENAQLNCEAVDDEAGGLSRNTRSVVSRALKRIAAAGLACDIAWTCDAAAIAQELEAVIDIHRRRNRQLRGIAGLDDPGLRALFERTVHGHAEAGHARLLTLRLDGALAAFAICFESAGVLYVYSNMASPDWLDYSPGTIANAEVVRAAGRDPGLRAVDWGPGIQRYKLSGPRVRVRPLVHLWAWSSLVGRLAWALGDRLAQR